MKQPKVDQTKCMGCGTCTVMCSNTFSLNGATATVSNPSGNTEEEISKVLELCPANAIQWEEKS